jgi:ASPIC and UnbV/FG-GAP-like repeat
LTGGGDWRRGWIWGGLALLLVGLVAKAPPHARAAESRAVNWAKARDAAGKYRTVIDLAGLVEVDSRMPDGVDPEDLRGLCTAHQEAVKSLRREAEASLRELGTWRDPVADEEKARLDYLLAAADAFEGDMKAAQRHVAASQEALRPYTKDAEARARSLVLEATSGVVSMRQGEMDNCLVNPSTDRCLFPLRPGGVHRATAGAEAALESFKTYLAAHPDDLEVRWLLNLAYMVLGRYPQGVPKDQLIPPSAFSSEGEMPRFTEVAQAAGLGRRDIAGGTIVDDFDGDGLLDVVFSSVDYCSPLRLYRNRGDGTFEDRTQAAGLQDELGGLNIVQTDYDNDGRLDIFVMRGGWEMAMRNSLLHNNGDGTFTDVTRAAGLSSAQFATHSAAWADYDNDGWLDVFVGHELAPSQLFRNRGDGTFEDVSSRAGVGATAFTKGATWGDYDNDGFPDLYVSNMYGDNFLYHNNGDGTFTEVGAKLGVQKPFTSFPTWFFDYDNDGWLDIFVSSYPTSMAEFAKRYVGEAPTAETLTLYHNNGDGTFTDVSRNVGLDRVVPTMGANFGDLDNDGFLDMYLGTGFPSFGALIPNIMLRNDAGTRFLDVTAATGTGHLQKGHGIGFGDLDDDGNEDVVLNVGGAVPGDNYDEALFRNPGGYGNHWISLHLVGVKSNRPAIGARITLRLSGAGPGSQTRHREVTSGGSFGASSLTQHIGVGKAKVIDTLEVYWPTSRTRQVFHDVTVDRFLELRELDDHLSERQLPRFRIGAAAN